MNDPARTLRTLLVEDTPDDAELVLLQLRSAGYLPIHERVDDAPAMRNALRAREWDVVIADYEIPGFGALAALRTLHELAIDLPFIIVSGTVGEDIAVEGLRAGAHDFMSKSSLTRLVPAIEREVKEAATRRANRAAAEALRASEERFRTLVASMDDIVFTLDRQQRYSDLFGRWPQHEGIDPATFLGKTATEVFGSEAGVVHEQAQTRALAGERVVYEWSVDVPAGPRHFQISLSPRYGASGQVIGAVGVGRDISELRRIQAQLLFSDRMVSIGTLAAGVAHEINNPLACVIANLDLLSHQAVGMSSQLQDPELVTACTEELRDCVEAARRVRDIVRDLRIFSRGADECVGPVDVRAVLESSIRMAWNELRHRARIVRNYSDVPPVSASDARLGQVFLNLIVNAAQAIAEGNAEANQISVETRVLGDQVLVSISDTGPGIPPDVLRRLFTPFVTTKPPGEGTGLGLSICKRIVTSFGGEIHVDSKPGEGTTFEITLPTATRPISTPSILPAISLPASRRGRVLLVDDDPLIGKVVIRGLKDLHDVCALPRARQAIERIASGERFDVIFCDVMMPEMSGMDFYIALHELAPDQAAAVVFLTGGAFTPGALHFLDSVPNPRVDKPFDMRNLRTLIAARLD
jgi:PAS domain S-box-containing protein